MLTIHCQKLYTMFQALTLEMKDTMMSEFKRRRPQSVFWSLATDRHWEGMSDGWCLWHQLFPLREAFCDVSKTWSRTKLRLPSQQLSYVSFLSQFIHFGFPVCGLIWLASSVSRLWAHQFCLISRKEGPWHWPWIVMTIWWWWFNHRDCDGDGDGDGDGDINQSAFY